ncbi:ER membrane protein SH3-domain-containing protein [Cristinia sonorae]|uniref:ER membrane protein SH3-domain-containing protein n=1 Tax=Cristinia sonorae TaxID=1940300 RepID=A0A8K0USJ9_9AGAR|nr:ER membrane protein SH3-domain-containing protein [Cristinia sonorae]
MAGLRISIFICAVSFLLGLLFTHWIADSLTLWKSPATQTDLRLWTSATYYSILSRMPPVLLYIYGGVVVLGGATLLWSLGDGRAGNLMFDGGSAVLYGTAVAVYLYSVLPNLFTNFTTLPLPFVSAGSPSPSSIQSADTLPPFPPSLRGPTFELASSHLVCSVALTGVLALQAGRWWAEQKDVEDGDDALDLVDGGKEKKD